MTIQLRHRAIALALLALKLALVSAACTPRPKPPRLVLLFATCSLNKSYLAPYSPRVPFTPNLRAFQAQALTFERHQTEAGQSGTAFAALFSGSQAMNHGIYRHPDQVSEDVELITEAFADADWNVNTWFPHPMAHARLGYAQGVPEAQARKTLLQAGEPDFEALLDKLSQQPQARAFIATAFSATHPPYKGLQLDDFCRRYPGECAPRRDEARFLELTREHRANHLEFSFDFDRAVARRGYSSKDVHDLAAAVELLYKADVAFLDGLFGGVVAAIEKRGLLDQSLIVFTSDHGEILYRENERLKWTHGYQLAPEVLNVAMMVRAPESGVRAGRYAAVTRSVDVFPTLAALAGLPAAVHGTGRDLSRALRGDERPPELVAFSHTELFAPPTWEGYQKYPGITSYFPDVDPKYMWVAARRGDRVFKLCRSLEGRFEPLMFDLAQDPTETHNRFDPGDEGHRQMQRELELYKAQLVAGFDAPRGLRRELGLEEQQERLRALGYIK